MLLSGVTPVVHSGRGLAGTGTCKMTSSQGWCLSWVAGIVWVYLGLSFPLHVVSPDSVASSEFLYMMTGSQDRNRSCKAQKSHSITSMAFYESKRIRGPVWVPQEGIQTPPLDGKSGMNLQEWKG